MYTGGRGPLTFGGRGSRPSGPLSRAGPGSTVFASDKKRRVENLIEELGLTVSTTLL
jgi:hypothetical protein